MARNPYKMRKVVREFTMPNRANPAIQSPREELDCGHIVRAKTVYTKSEAFSRLMGDMVRQLTKELRKRRCYQCGAAGLTEEE